MSMITLIHRGGSTKDVEVLGIDASRLPMLLLVWPLAGMYVLDINRNQVSSVIRKANKSAIMPWVAYDKAGAYSLWAKLKAERDLLNRPYLNALKGAGSTASALLKAKSL